MKYSHKWLEDYLEDKLPDWRKVEEALNLKAFEVEGVEEVSYMLGDHEVEDVIYDIKVLPNRAHDALSHYYMAHEIAACLNLKKKSLNLDINKYTKYFKNQSEEVKIDVRINESKACSRFAYAYVSNVRVGATPEIIRRRLDAIGERSINNIVDITNYVQYSINKPMHAYDADILEGDISVRYADKGEELLTLDDKVLKLTGEDLVIADSKKSLGLAGIKGGKYSGITSSTKNIFIESANFSKTQVRKSSTSNNTKTDASKRFENGLSDKLVIDGLVMTLDLILEQMPEAHIEYYGDTWPDYNKVYKVGVSKEEINNVLGSNMSDAEIVSILGRLGMDYVYVKPIDVISALSKKLIGVPYKRGASVSLDAPRLFDCSSLVNYIYSEAWGIIPRMTIDQYVFSYAINESERKVGDLIFINTKIERAKSDMIYSKVLGVELIDVPSRDKSVEFLRGVHIEGGVDHVGIYLGDNKVLHSSGSNGMSAIEDLETSQIFKDAKVSYRRVTQELETGRYIVTVPDVRLDIRHRENMIEEIGRIYGYENLRRALPDLTRSGVMNNASKSAAMIRGVLISFGFSEVINYSLVATGEVEILKSASDKNHLRTNLSDGLMLSLNKNINNMPLLGSNIIKTFEIGNVWTNGREEIHLAIAVDDGKKKSNHQDLVSEIVNALKARLNTNLKEEIKSQKPLIIEIDLSETVNATHESEEDGIIDYELGIDQRYKSFSLMPFIVRDIAFWVSDTEDLAMLETKIRECAGDLCVSISLFDKFSKEGKTSYGYRLIYQDNIRTLTDEEVNGYASNVYNMLTGMGAEIR